MDGTPFVFFQSNMKSSLVVLTCVILPKICKVLMHDVMLITCPHKERNTCHVVKCEQLLKNIRVCERQKFCLFNVKNNTPQQISTTKMKDKTMTTFVEKQVRSFRQNCHTECGIQNDPYHVVCKIHCSFGINTDEQTLHETAEVLQKHQQHKKHSRSCV